MTFERNIRALPGNQVSPTEPQMLQGQRSARHLDSYPLPEAELAAFDVSRPHKWQSSLYAPWNKIWRQHPGFKSIKSNYLSLYQPLDSLGEQSLAITGVVFAIAAGVPLPLIGYIFGKIVNDFPPEEGLLNTRIHQLLGVAAGYFVSSAIYLTAFGLTAENVSVKLRKSLLQSLLQLEQAYLDVHELDVNGLLTEKVDAVQAGCSEKVGILIQAISYFVAAFVVGFILDAKLTGILLASVVPALALTFGVLAPAVSKHTRAASELDEQGNSLVESALRSVRIVQAFDMLEDLCSKHLDLVKRSTDSSIAKAAFAATQIALVYFIAYCANALAFYLGSRQSSDSNAGTVYAVVFLIIDASFVVGQFAPFLEIFATAASANAIIRNLLDACKLQTAKSKDNGDGNTPSLRGLDIVFENVEFEYPARPTVKVLKGVNLILRSGMLNALVGTSGGGKSTLTALLLGIYDYSGHIRYGDHEIRSLDATNFRSQIALVDQDTTLFSGTLHDNLCFGLTGSEFTEEEKTRRCKQALTSANAEFWQQLPHGLQCQLGNEVQLSGGQRQRVCLARAMIKQPTILIVDEPTSALDARSEQVVMKQLKRIAASGTTVVMIAHRLSTTLDADFVAVMHEGRAIEQGSPRELCVQGTFFRGLLDAQSTNATASDIPGGIDAAQDDGFSTKAGTDSTGSDTLVEDLHNSARLSFWNAVEQFGGMMEPDRYLIALGVIASVISGALLLAQAAVFGNLIEVLNVGSADPSFYDQADFFCLIFFLLAIVTFASYSCSGTSFGVTSTHLLGQVKSRLLRNLLRLDMQWFSETGHSTHALMEAFTKDTGDLSALGGIALGSIFTILTSVIGGIILAHCVAWKIAVVLLTAVPIMIASGYCRFCLITAAENKHREAYSGATILAAEASRKRRIVTSLSLEKYFLDKYDQALHEPYRQVCKFVVYANTLLAFSFSVAYFIYALAYWWGSKQVRNGSYTTAQFFTVMPALLFSAQYAGQLFSLSPEMARMKSAGSRLLRLINARPRIMSGSDPRDLRTSTSTISFSRLKGPDDYETSESEEQFAFNNVSLVYPNATQCSLKGLNLSVSRGQTVAFVGPSGAGKSTALAMLERFYDPSQGSVSFRGTDLKHINVRHLRAQIAYVSQDSELFPGTISYNIKLGAAPGQTVTDIAVEWICRECGIHDFIISLPDGYNTECGSGSSSQLSGGQRQRIAIARALVRNPKVLLLDEPTSALDALTEAKVQDALSQAATGRTTVIVSHRLASIQHADQIFVFDQGKLAAQGTHAELMAQRGLYASMAKVQSLV